MTTTTTPTTRAALIEALNADGFTIGKPVHVAADCLAIDRTTAAESSCDSCGHQGLEFLPFRPADLRKRGYRCVCFCAVCDTAFEL
jgi:hypothetical protein